MFGQRDIWMISSDPAASAAVRSVLEMHGLQSLIRECPGLAKLASVSRGDDCETVIVDLDASPLHSLRELEQAVLRFPKARFVVMSGHADSDLLMGVMNAGARHFVVKSKIEQELPRIIQRLQLSASGPGATAGSLITVLSAGGGCGATTLAVNLAAELPRKDDQAALLVDMDNAYGTIASYLGLSGSYGLAEVMSYDKNEQIDPQLVTTTALKFNDQIHALINPVSVNYTDPAPLRYERLEPTMQACQQAYPWVVIDAPRVPIALAARLALMSRFTLIVGQLSVKDIRMSRDMHGALVRHGVSSDSVRYVINRYRSRHSLLSLDEARRALGGGELIVVKNDFSNATESINMGQPLAHCAPRCNARKDIMGLAERLAVMQGNGHMSLLHSHN